jgi:phage/plasmid primase-like uncharacterized protein
MISNEAQKVNRISDFQDLNPFQFKEDLKEDMKANGLPYLSSEDIRIDESWHHYNGDSERPHKKNESYIASEAIQDGMLKGYIATYCSWRNSNVYYTYCSWSSLWNTFNKEEKEERRKLLEDIREQNLIKFEREKQQRAFYIQGLYKKLTQKPFDVDHKAYLIKKNIKDYGIYYGTSEYYNKAALIIPAITIDGKVTGLQYIYKEEDGTFKKLWYKESYYSESFFVLNNGIINPQDTVIICEGYATAATIFEALEADIYTNIKVIVTFGSTNIENCVRVIYGKFPEARIIVAADNEPSSLNAARRCEELYNSSTCVPEITKEEHGGDDFNDLAALKGLKEIKECFEKKMNSKTKTEELQEYAASRIKTNDPCGVFDINKMPPVLRDYVTELCEASQGVRNIAPIMMTNVVLAMLTGFIKKRFYTYVARSAPRLYCNLWMLNIGESGIGKSYALSVGSYLGMERREEVYRFLRNNVTELDLGNAEAKKKNEQEKLKYFLQDIFLANRMTSEGLMEDLSLGRGGVIMHNEFANLIQNLEKQFNGDLKGTLTDFYDCSKNATTYKKANAVTITIDEPFISISSMSTIEWVKKNLTLEDSSAGFAARILMFNIMPLPQPDRSEFLPPSLCKNKVDVTKDIHSIMRGITEKILPPVGNVENNVYKEREFLFSDESWKYYCTQRKYITDFLKQFDDKTRKILTPFANRWETSLVKLAMIMQFLYVQECDEGPVNNQYTETSTLEVRAFEAAMNILECAMNSTAFLYTNELGISEHDEKCNKLYNYIVERTHQSKVTLYSNILKSRILKGGTKEYDYILETLINSDLIEAVKNSTDKNKKNIEYRLRI